MPRLTNAETTLIENPPTRGTWLCRAKRQAGEETIVCGQANAAAQTQCWLCTKPKPRNPILMWPKYEAACKKAGLEPTGKRHRFGAPAEQPATRPKARRQVKRGR